MKTLILVLFLMYSCNTSKNAMVDCNKSEVQKITDDLMRKKGYDLNSLIIIIDETTDYYIIKYILKDTMSLGGGAEMKILKKDCKIVDGKLYQ